MEEIRRDLHPETDGYPNYDTHEKMIHLKNY